MHYTSTQPNDAEYPDRRDNGDGYGDSARGPQRTARAPYSRMDRKARRNRKGNGRRGAKPETYDDSVHSVDSHTTPDDNFAPNGQQDRYHENSRTGYSSGHNQAHESEVNHASGAATTGRRQTRRVSREALNNESGGGVTEAERFIDELESFEPATRRGSKWREWLIARHSVTETGFPVFAGMRPVVGFLLIPGLLVLGITLTGGHWPIEVLYPLAMAMGLWVLFSAFRGVELVLAVLLFYVPFSPVYVIPLAPGINGTNSLVALGLLAVIVQARTKSVGWMNWRKGTFMILVYAAITTASGLTMAVMHPDGHYYLFGDEFHNYKGWIEQFIIYFIALSCIRDHATAKRVFFYMVVGSVLVVIYTLPEMYSKFGLSSIEKSRVNGPLGQANEFGGLLAYTLMFSGGLFLAYFRHIRAWLAAPYFLLALKLLISTFSRGAYLALAVGGLAAGYLRGKVFFAAWGVAAIVFFAIFPQFIPDSIVARLNHSVANTESTAAPKQLDKSSEHRLILWKAAADMTLESPIIGKGFKGFPKIKHLYTERPVHEKDPHNYYLYVASQMGLPALVIFLFILLFAFSMGWRLSKHPDDTYIRAMGIAGASAVVTYSAVCMFGSRAVNPEFTAYFWVMIACMQVLCAKDEPEALSADPFKHQERRRRMQSYKVGASTAPKDGPKRLEYGATGFGKSTRGIGKGGRKRTNAFEAARAAATSAEQAERNHSAGDAANADLSLESVHRNRLTHNSGKSNRRNGY